MDASSVTVIVAICFVSPASVELHQEDTLTPQINPNCAGSGVAVGALTSFPPSTTADFVWPTTEIPLPWGSRSHWHIHLWLSVTHRCPDAWLLEGGAVTRRPRGDTLLLIARCLHGSMHVRAGRDNKRRTNATKKSDTGELAGALHYPQSVSIIWFYSG